MPEMTYVVYKKYRGDRLRSGDYGAARSFLKSGETYLYYNVEQWRFDELMQADSKGTYLNANVKGHYDYSKF